MTAPLRVAGIVSGVAALAYLVAALRLPQGAADRPGAGIYPLLVGVLWLAASLVFLLGRGAATEEAPADFPSGADLRRVASVVLATAAYILVLLPLGHVLAGGLLMLVVLRLLGLAAWPLLLGVSAAVALASYALFNLVLGVPLPAGAWLP